MGKQWKVPLVQCLLLAYLPSSYATPHHLSPSPALPWLLEVGLGYSHYQHMSNNDGNTALLRLGIGKILYKTNKLNIGAELGVQSGDQGNVNLSQAEIDALGGIAVNTTFKPMMDFLLTSTWHPTRRSNFFMLAKAGAALRTWQFNRASINEITRVNPEIQFGIGADVSRFATVSLVYQGIIGRNPNFQVNTTMQEATVSNIPSVNSIMLNLSMRLDGGILK